MKHNTIKMSYFIEVRGLKQGEVTPGKDRDFKSYLIEVRGLKQLCIGNII